MTPKQFAKAITRLGIKRNQAPLVLGISRASVFNYLAGTQAVPVIVERFITLLLRRGIPKEWRP